MLDSTLSNGFVGIEERIDRIRSRRPFFATPVYRDTSLCYTVSMCSTVIEMERIGIGRVCRHLFVVGNSNLPKARNELVAEFLGSDCTDLIFIDSDMKWEKSAVSWLLASERQVIGGVGRKKCPEPNTDPRVWCARFKPDIVQDEMGAILVDAIGTGFLKIERGVFEALIEAHPEWKRRGPGSLTEAARNHYHRFFVFDAEDPNEPGEDFGFCQAWRALGGSVWIDPEIALGHTGPHEYGGRVSDLFSSTPTE
jgi:hypothetical protein